MKDLAKFPQPTPASRPLTTVRSEKVLHKDLHKFYEPIHLIRSLSTIRNRRVLHMFLEKEIKIYLFHILSFLLK